MYDSVLHDNIVFVVIKNDRVPEQSNGGGVFMDNSQRLEVGAWQAYTVHVTPGTEPALYF